MAALTPEQKQKKREAQARWLQKQKASLKIPPAETPIVSEPVLEKTSAEQPQSQESENISSHSLAVISPPNEIASSSSKPSFLSEEIDLSSSKPSFLSEEIDLSSSKPSFLSEEIDLSSSKIKKERGEIIFSIFFSISISILLCIFQAETYIEDGMSEPKSWAASVICEIGLCYLAISLRSSFLSFLLWITLFSYSLATMSYGLYKTKLVKTEEVKISKIEEDQEKTKRETLRDLFESSKIAFDISASKGHITSANKILTEMKEIGDKIEEESPSVLKTAVSKDEDLINFQAYGLIALRAILMILNALLIHRIFSFFSLESSVLQGYKREVMRNA